MLTFITLMLLQTKDLGLAASQMNLKEARALVEAGADVNGFNAAGETPLMLAAKTGYNDMVTFLLEKGARTEAVTQLGETALFYALKLGRLEATRSLVAAGSPLNSRNRAGYTPLALAMARKDLAACEILIKGGANLRIYNAMGENLLHRAVLFDSPGLAKMIMEQGVDPNDKASARYSPLKLARFLYNEPMVAVLEGREVEKMHPLEAAIARGDLEKAQSLYKEHVSWRNLHGDTPLMLASRYGRSKVLTALLDQGAEVNEAGENGRTALLEAVRHGRISCAAVLLAKKADPNAITDPGSATPLSLAFANKDISLLNLLVAYHGRLITRDPSGAPQELPHRRVTVHIIQNAVDTYKPYYTPAPYAMDGPLEKGLVDTRHPGLTGPEITKSVEASYKSKEMKGPTTGEVTLSAIIGRDGSLRRIKVERPQQGFEYFAARAFRQWKFKPAGLDGKSVPTRASFKISIFRDN